MPKRNLFGKLERYFYISAALHKKLRKENVTKITNLYLECV